MKFALASIVANVPCIACVAIAGHLALRGLGGWGWFLLAGLIICKSIKLKGDE